MERFNVNQLCTSKRMTVQSRTIVTTITLLTVLSARDAPLKSDSLPHAHAQTKKTYYKHQDSRIKKARELKIKTSVNPDIQDIPSRYQVYLGRLLASFKDDAKYEHVGQVTRSQGGKDNQDKQGKDLEISELKTKSKDNDKGSRSKITQHEGTSLQRRQRQRSQALNDKSNLIIHERIHNETTSGEIDFQENSNDEVDERSSEKYLRDLDIEFYKRALLANSKHFIKRNNFSSQKANENTECYKCGKKGHFAKDCFSKTSEPTYKSPVTGYSSVSKTPTTFQPKNKSLVAKTFDWDEEEVSDDEEVTQIKLTHALQEQLKEEKKINEKWLTSSKKVSQCISGQIPHQKKKVISGEMLIESSLKMNENENIFVPASMRILLPESQVVNESLKPTKTSNTPKSSKDSKMESLTPLPPLKNHQRASPSSKVMPLTFQTHSPKERPGLGIMKHTKPKTQDSLNKSVSGTIIVSKIEPTTHSVPTDVKDIEQESKINELTKIVQMLIDKKQTLKAKAKPFPSCTHYGFNNQRPDDCRNYPECGICGSYDHFTSGHNRVIHIGGGVLAESSQSSESSIGVKCNTCGSTVHSTTDHNEFVHFKRETHQGAYLVPGQWMLKEYDWCQELSAQICKATRMVENQNDVKVKQIRTDKGAEFRNYELETERKNRTLIEAARTMLNRSVLSKHFWTEGVRIACYTQNRSIIVKRNDKTPYDIFRERIPDISYFHVFGFPVVFNTRRQQVEETYHVTFDKSMEAIRFNTSHDEIGIDDSSRYPPDEFLYKDDPSRQYQVDSDVSYYVIPHGRPPNLINTERTHEQNVQNEEITTQHTEGPSGNNTQISVSINESSVLDVPRSHISNQASISSHPAPRDRWSKDQHIELVNIIGDPGEGMLTRSMVAKLIAASTSGCLFADFLSEIEPKKAPNGKEGKYNNESFAQARIEAIKIFLAFATYMNFKVYQIDVKSAFLNGKLKEEVYVKRPPGFESSDFPDYVCKLDKALYGLKQAPKACSSVKTPMVPPNNLGPDLAGKPVNE
ncbi:retrovirus-related pol polyprotein from transposon TNT 1-94 [Tanacetum coccineum]